MIYTEQREFRLADLLQRNYCPKCGYEVDENTNFCPSCGHSIKDYYRYNRSSRSVYMYEEYKEINKWLSFILCFFFGMFGAHKFYEGKTLEGIIYLFTCGLFGIGYIVDLFIILFKPDPYFVIKK